MVRIISIGLAGIVVVAALSGCWGVLGQVVRGNGKLIQEERDVRGYTRVVLSGSGRATIVQNSQQGVTVSVDENLADYVLTEVRGDTLYLGWKNGASGLSLRSAHRLEFVVSMDQIEGLTTSGSGDIVAESITGQRIDLGTSGSGNIRVDALTSDDLRASLSGSGGIQVEGQTRTQQVQISGSGNYEGSGLRSQEATVNASGSGKARVWVRDTLEAHLSGSGQVEYYGESRVDSHTSGSGRMVALGER